MSLFGNLFGKPFETLETEAKQLFENGRFGEAKLALDKAIAKGKDAAKDRIDSLKEMVETCKRQLAEGRLAEADRLAATGELENAMAALADAVEIFDAPEIHAAVQERLKRFEVADTRRLVEEVDEIDDDELMTIIAGTWSDSQADEYAAMPDRLRDAFLAGHDERHSESVEILKDILTAGDFSVTPKYIYLELGKACLQADSPADAVESLDTFLSVTANDEDALEARLAANDMKATALIALERLDEAETVLRESCRLAPENHTVFLRLGIFLRSRENFDGSVKALEMARELMGQMHPDFAVIRELGFTYLTMGQKEEAKACFGAVIEHLASRGEHTQFDPTTAMALAALHEESKDYTAAADLYRHLSVGYDTQNHFRYNLEAARLLKLAHASADLIDRYLTRAGELADTDEARARLASIEEQ